MQFSKTVSRSKALASLNMDFFFLSLKFISLQHGYVLINLSQRVHQQLAHWKDLCPLEKPLGESFLWQYAFLGPSCSHAAL